MRYLLTMVPTACLPTQPSCCFLQTKESLAASPVDTIRCLPILGLHQLPYVRKLRKAQTMFFEEQCHRSLSRPETLSWEFTRGDSCI